MKKVNRKRSQEPSRASLRAMPEADFSKAKPNPHARRIATEGFSIQVERGRPRRAVGAPLAAAQNVNFSASTRVVFGRRRIRSSVVWHEDLTKNRTIAAHFFFL